jgi:ABC-type uncharacterized transport system involved in gliding motility auxiliary subunit
MANNSEKTTEDPIQAEDAHVTGTLGGYLQKTFGLVGRWVTVLAGVGAGAILLGGILFLAVPILSRTALTVLAIGGVLVLISITVSFSSVRMAVTGRRGRYSTNAIVMVVVFVLIAALVAFVGFRNSVRMDVTATKQFSLAPQTVDVLENLPEPVRASGFFVPGEPIATQVSHLMREFEIRAGAKFTYRLIDPETKPAIARQYNVSRYGTVVFEGMNSGRKTPVFTLSTGGQPNIQEQQFLTALLIASGVERKSVYFLSGHGEKNPSDINLESTDGFGVALEGLRGDNYEPKPLNLAQDVAIPDDATVVVVADPKGELTEEEGQQLHIYLKKGGRMVLLLESTLPVSWNDFLNRWGIEVGPETIVDTTRSLAADSRTIIPQFLPGVEIPIAQQLGPTYFPGAAPLGVTLAELPDTIRILPLALTSPATSWGTTNDEGTEYKPDSDVPGPLIPALAIQAISPPGEAPDLELTREIRLVVFGDSDFASNRFFYVSSNADLFLNSINWLAGDINLISVRPKPFAFRQLVVNPRELTFIRYSSWLMLPLAIAIIGGLIWWRRR